MENQIHQEFQRLRIELDKISSYSHTLEKAEENIQETTQLIQHVGEKYENLVDLIWREFNEEIDSLKELKNQIHRESSRVEETLQKLQQEGISIQQMPEAKLPKNLLQTFGERLQLLESRIQGQYDTLLQHVTRFTQVNQNLEGNLGKKIDIQINQLTNRLSQLDSQLQQTLKESLNDALTRKLLAKDPANTNPLNNGLGQHLKDQLESIQQKIHHTDVQLKDLIKGSLEESLSSLMEQYNTSTLTDEVPEKTSIFQSQITDLSKKIEESDRALRNIVRGMNVQMEELIGSSQSQLSTSLVTEMEEKLTPKLEAFEGRLSQSQSYAKELFDNLSRSFDSITKDSEDKLKLFQQVSNTLKPKDGEDTLESIKKVTRNQFQKLLDYENDMKKQKQLLGIVTVISLLNLVMIIIMIITFTQVS